MVSMRISVAKLRSVTRLALVSEPGRRLLC